MSQPAVLPALSALSTGQRHLRVVDPQGRPDTPLVGYLVLAPEGTPPAELFSQTVTVRRVDPRQPLAGPPPSAGPLPASPASGHRGGNRSARLTPTANQPTSADDAGVAPEGHQGLWIDHERFVATVDGEELDLTYLEFELLAHLVAHPLRVHSRAALVSAVWGYDYPGDGRTVDVHVARLRRKLGVERRSSIVTVRRVGYKYVPRQR